METFFLIDKDDYEKVSKYCWNFNKCTNYWNAFDVVTNTRKSFKLHQLILPNSDENLVVDHYNRNTSDNRKSNLFLKSRRDNCINSGLQSNNTSGYIGVVFNEKENKWRVCISVENKKFRIVARFDDLQDAVTCRLVYEYHLYGENAPQRDLFEQYGITAQFVEEYLSKKKRANNTSGMTGIHFNKKTHKYMVYVSVDKKLKHLGFYETFEQAAKVRLEAEKEYYPEEKWQKRYWKEYGIDG